MLKNVLTIIFNFGSKAIWIIFNRHTPKIENKIRSQLIVIRFVLGLIYMLGFICILRFLYNMISLYQLMHIYRFLL